MQGKDSPQCHSRQRLHLLLRYRNAKGRATPPLPSPRAGTGHGTPALPAPKAGLFSAGMFGMTKFSSRIGEVPPAPSGSALAPGTGSGPCSTAASSQQQVVFWDQPDLVAILVAAATVPSPPSLSTHWAQIPLLPVPLFLGKISTSIS